MSTDDSSRNKIFRPYAKRGSEFRQNYQIFIRQLFNDKLSIYINPANSHRYEHGQTIVSKDWDGNQHDTQMKPVEASATLLLDRVKKGEAIYFFEFGNSIVEPMVSHLVKSLFEMVGEAADKHGNVVDGKGAPLSPELVLEAFSKIGVTITKDGKISLPQMHVSPAQFEKLKQIGISSELQEKYNKLLEEKVAQAVEEEQNRLKKFPVNKDRS